MLKRILFPVILFFAVLASAALLVSLLSDNKPTEVSVEPKSDSMDLVETPKPPSQDDKSNVIKISTPKALEKIESPLTIRGEARGTWFFEGSFSIELVDDEDNEIAFAIAQAQSDWMTEEFVPFVAEINFSVSQVERGFLVFQKDNPSGLPENDVEYRMPVELNKEKIAVFVYFATDETAGENDLDCNYVEPVERQVGRTLDAARTAVEELIKGPTDAEKSEGFLSNINKNTRIKSLEIKNGVAKVDLSPDLEYQVAGSCLVATIRAQIEETLMQFETVDSVEISIDGRTEDILQP